MTDWSGVRDVIGAAEAAGCSVGVAIIAPDGEIFAHRGEEPVKSASTIKIAIMIEVFRAVDRGEVRLDGRYRLRGEDKVPGSGVLQHLHDGLELTIADVLYLMMSISDNPATNILINLVGMDQVNATMRDLGLVHSMLGRTMQGRPANPDERENVATPFEFARMVEAILHGSAASEASCEQMVRYLKLQQNTRRIGRYVPEGVEWGSKTGSYATVVNDVGFVRSDAGRLVISIFTSDVPEVVTGEQIVADIARAGMVAAGVAEE